MEHCSLLKHFSLKLGEAEKLDNVSGKVENVTSNPQCPEDFFLYSKGAGMPVIFPATWCPPWSRILNSITPLEGIANLLGNEIEVDVFTLQYGAHLFEVAPAAVSKELAVCEVFPRHSKRRKLGRNQTANVCPNPMQDLKLLPPTSAVTSEARPPNHPSTIPLAPLWPIPRSGERRYRLGDFLKEAAARNKASNDSLLYLTWRGLPSPSSAAKSTSIKLTRFINACVEPAIAPPFLEAKRIKQRNLWIGNSVTSQIHFDGLDNLHVCIQGKKTFHLYPPCDTPNLYPKAWAEGSLNNKSTIPSILCADTHTHKKFFSNTHGLKAEVSAGQAIYIPAGWWHEVFTLGDMSCSVNAWFDSPTSAHFRPTLMMLHSEKYFNKLMGVEEGDEGGIEGSGEETDDCIQQSTKSLNQWIMNTNNP